MNGERTCVILGAGASRMYTRGHGQMPLQSDIAEKLFMGVSRGGSLSVGGLSLSSGLRHSERLATFLREFFGIDEPPEDSRLQLWKELQARGYSLERLYAELVPISVGEDVWVIREFEAIVRTVISEVVNRSTAGVCEYHRALVRALEPGDYIVNFNWDTITSDALYYCSRLWFPITGFGRTIGILPRYPADAVSGKSYLMLIHVHGCNALYTIIEESGRELHQVIYIPPDTYDPSSSMIQSLRLPEYDSADKKSGALRNPTPEEMARFDAGWIRMPSGEWLKPLFVPPTSEKPQYDHWYHRGIIGALHTLLPGTKRFVLAGYSVPSADLTYLDSLFVPAVIDREARVTIVNRENEHVEFRRRVDRMFPNVFEKDYSHAEFSTFCGHLMETDERLKHGEGSDSVPSA